MSGTFDESVNNFEEALRSVNRVISYRTRVFLAQRGLSMSRFQVLLHLRTGQGTNMGCLQSHLLLAPATITGLVDGLVNDGLVERWRDEEDRRVVYLRLTGAGEDLRGEVLDFWRRCLKDAIDVAPEELDRVSALLRGIHEGLKKDVTQPGGDCKQPE
ncbi:MAG: MarR family winged helix-turn-helix transcriptional regulator [Bacillota bacterium]